MSKNIKFWRADHSQAAPWGSWSLTKWGREGAGDCGRLLICTVRCPGGGQCQW